MNYSQEDLAIKLDVTRQSISKWETDVSIPEIDKLVLLSNLFDVSLDYLVKNEVNENITKKMYHKKEFFTSVYSTIFTIGMLLLFNLKILKIPIEIGSIFTPTTYIDVNVYDLLNDLYFGNFLMMLIFLGTILMGIFGSLILFVDNKKRFYLTRNILSVAITLILLIFMTIYVDYIYFNTYLFNSGFLIFEKQNKYNYIV